MCTVWHPRLGYLPAPLLSFVAALANGSHGMGFGLKCKLMVLMLATDLATLPICGKVALDIVLCDTAAVIVGSVAQHGQTAPFGTAPAPPLCVFRARLAALRSSALPE